MEIKLYSRYDESEIRSLYEAVGWRNYFENLQMLRASYENSLCILGAYQNDALIGVIRAVGDGASILLIQDIVVHPLYQRMGIGTKLVKAMLEQYSHVYQTQLITDDTEKTKAFYKSVGFKPMNELGCCGFIKM